MNPYFLQSLTLGPENYNTPVRPDMMPDYNNWLNKSAHPLDIQSAQAGTSDYDYGGLYNQMMQNRQAQAGYNYENHFPDTFKKPNHPTFSDQSQYAMFGNPGNWVGNDYFGGGR